LSAAISLGFQWDIPAAGDGFSCHFSRRPRQVVAEIPRAKHLPSATVLWLCRWLLFRLMFMSGAVVKRVELRRDAWAEPDRADDPLRDPAVADLDRMVCAPIARIGFKRRLAGIMFVIELAAPVLIFFGKTSAPDRLRGFRPADAADFAHRQLLLLQPAHDDALCVVAGRWGVPAPMGACLRSRVREKAL